MFGALFGMKMFNKISNPVTRNRMKRKLIRIKEAIFSKES
jgi:hypothetical protein